MREELLIQLAVAEVRNGKEMNEDLIKKVTSFYKKLIDEINAKPEPPNTAKNENMYIVKYQDLRGYIGGFPLEVVQQMVNEQVAQGNEADVTIFQDGSKCHFAQGGFNWHDTECGTDFWHSVISGRNFDLFFQYYPKTNN